MGFVLNTESSISNLIMALISAQSPAYGSLAYLDSPTLGCDRAELRGNKKSFRTAINWIILSNRAHFPLALNAGDKANWFQTLVLIRLILLEIYRKELFGIVTHLCDLHNF